MTPAELKTRREALGLTVGWLAEQAGVGERTVRYWESGRNQVPDDVAGLILRIDAQAEKMVAEALAVVDETTRVHGGPPECVDLRRYATDAELWRKHPGLRPLPATFHASVLDRTRRALAGRGIESVIEYSN